MTAKTGDELLIVALASGATIKDAAATANMSERTAHRRLEDPAFKAAVSAARGEMLTRVVGQLVDACTEAVRTLRDLMGAEAESVRLGAARAVLDQANRLREATELEQRVLEIEERLASQGGKRR